MKNFSSALASELELKLQSVIQDSNNPIEYAEEAVQIVLDSMEQLRNFVKKANFATKTEEILFFKEIKPHFSSKLIYFNEIYNIEVGKPTGGVKAVSKYYNSEQNRLKQFYTKNSDFCKYYRTGNATLDKKYFLRRKHDIKLLIDSHFFQADYDFTTSHDFTVAHIIANDAIQKYIEQSRREVVKNVQENSSTSKPSFLKWTGTKVALVELLYAIHASHVINNGEISIKSIAQTAEQMFNINLGQFNRIFLEIKNRKSIEQTSFLNSLKSNLERKIEDSYKI